VQWDEFVKTPHLIAAGEAATREAIPQIKEVILRSATQRLDDRRKHDRRRNKFGRRNTLETRP
jgi:hypothetical protein